MSLEKVPKAAGIAVVLAMVALVALLSGCGGSSSGAGTEFTGSGYPGVDLANTRNVKAAIDSSNVAELEEAWTLPLEAQSTYGAYASTPIIDKGVIYSQDLVSNVQAIGLDNGEVQWEKKYESPTHGPNGLVVADGLVFGATATDAFALDQESGKPVWSVPLTRSTTESIDMAPGYNDGLVYVSTVPVTATETYGPGAAGTLWALDGKSGKKVWHFDTVPKSLWGNPQVNSGGGLWYPPSFDGKGSMYIGTGNPGPLPGTPKFPWGSSRPGPNLYADSVVALDTKTGKPVWKQPVGTHNGHDNDSLYAMRGEYSKIKTGEAFPGTLGGVIAPLATDGKSLYVPIVNHSMTVVSGSEISESSAATGEMAALDLATGKFKWKKPLPAPAYGAPTVVNDLVFETTADGTIYVLDTKSGGEVSQLKLPAGTNAGVMANGEYLIGAAGLPLEEGQVTELVAYKLGG